MAFHDCLGKGSPLAILPECSDIFSIIQGYVVEEDILQGVLNIFQGAFGVPTEDGPRHESAASKVDD